MEALGRQVVTNVRRSFDVRVGTKDIQIFIDGTSVINAGFGASVAPADYELLWVGFGYNTTKDGVPYFLQHWDNFGFDGPVVDARTVHNYVTRIEGTDYQIAQTRGAGHVHDQNSRRTASDGGHRHRRSVARGDLPDGRILAPQSGAGRFRARQRWRTVPIAATEQQQRSVQCIGRWVGCSAYRSNQARRYRA